MANTQEPANYKFGQLMDAIVAAGYVEQLLASEHQWIANRLSWLFISQSFCITAYAILSTSNGVREGAQLQLTVLRFGVPILGIICSLTVGLSVAAANAVVRHLANERARLTQYINTQSGMTIPLVGVDSALRQRNLRWTTWTGGLPGWLPWILMAFWLFILIHI